MEKMFEKKLIEDIGEKRYLHSLRVLDVALLLGKKYKLDLEKIKVAAILHDCAKYKDQSTLLKMASKFDIILDDVMKYNIDLIHGPLGSKVAEKKYGIVDIEVLDAIRHHTTGKKDMTMLDKIIYISDYIEAGRNFKGVEEVRNLTFKNIDKGILLAMENTIKFLIESRKLIHLDTIRARNKLRITLENNLN